MTMTMGMLQRSGHVLMLASLLSTRFEGLMLFCNLLLYEQALWTSIELLSFVLTFCNTSVFLIGIFG